MHPKISKRHFKKLAGELGVALPQAGLSGASAFDELLSWIQEIGSIEEGIDGNWALHAQLTEDRIISWIYENEEASGVESHLAGLLLISFIIVRLRKIETDFDQEDQFPITAPLADLDRPSMSLIQIEASRKIENGARETQ